MWHLTAYKIQLVSYFLNWIKNDFFYCISELMMTTVIQRHGKKNHFRF